jgi:hypothetical protein
LTPGAGYRSDGVVFMNSQDSFGVWQHQGADEAGQKRGKREDGSRGIGPVIINSATSPACVNNAADVRWCEIVAKQRPLRPTSPTGHWPKPGTVCKHCTGGSPTADFGKFIAEGTENWAKISKFVSSHAEKFVSYILVPSSKCSPTVTSSTRFAEQRAGIASMRFGHCGRASSTRQLRPKPRVSANAATARRSRTR